MVLEETNRSRSDIEAAIEKAVVFLPKNFVPRHEHSKRCYNVLKHILHEDEYTVIEAKQSLLKSIAPMRLVATNQRILVVKPSFWSLWTGHNIFSPTKYESIPYNNLMNITLYAGMRFSSTYLHLNTNMDNDAGKIEGLKTDDAKAMFIFLEKMTESLRKQEKENKAFEEFKSPNNKIAPNHIDLETSRKLIKYKGLKLVWLGVEPLEYAADKLDIDKSAIVKMSTEELMHKDKQEAIKLKCCIFVCYDGSFSTYISRFLKRNKNIDTYVLSGGIEYQAKKVLDLNNLNIKSATEFL